MKNTITFVGAMTVRQAEDGSYVVVHGASRLKAELAMKGQVRVLDAATGRYLSVHVVDGNLVALTEPAETS